MSIDENWIIIIMSKAFPWASYQIRKIAGCAYAGNAGNVFPRRRLQRKPLVSDPGMHHGTCVTHVPWCMSGSLTRGGRENVPGIPDACAPAILRICQEAHVITSSCIYPSPNKLVLVIRSEDAQVSRQVNCEISRHTIREWMCMVSWYWSEVAGNNSIIFTRRIW